MENKATPAPQPSRGEWVQVKSKEEILATLDAKGRLDEMPFMPEMLQYCGKKMQVGKRAHKTCDPALGCVGRKMTNAVHLENVRCDGSAHDGCDAGCLVFWKEAWLRRRDNHADGQGAEVLKPGGNTRAPGCTEETLWSSIKVPPATGEADVTYVCQNTQVKIATQPLEFYDVRQYVEDYTSGNVSLSQLASGFLYFVWRTVTEAGSGWGRPCVGSTTGSRISRWICPIHFGHSAYPRARQRPRLCWTCSRANGSG